MENPTFLPVHSLSYLTTKGYMYPALGNVWNLKYDLPTISWNSPRPPDESCLPAIIQGLEYEIGQLEASNAPVPGDFYFWGGAIAAKARLALVVSCVFVSFVHSAAEHRLIAVTSAHVYKLDCRACRTAGSDTQSD